MTSVDNSTPGAAPVIPERPPPTVRYPDQRTVMLTAGCGAKLRWLHETTGFTYAELMRPWIEDGVDDVILGLDDGPSPGQLERYAAEIVQAAEDRRSPRS